MEVAEHPGDAAMLKELRRMLFGDRRAIALHRLDFDYPRQELPHTAAALISGSHGIHARSSITSATTSPLQ